MNETITTPEALHENDGTPVLPSRESEAAHAALCDQEEADREALARDLANAMGVSGMGYGLHGDLREKVLREWALVTADAALAWFAARQPASVDAGTGAMSEQETPRTVEEAARAWAAERWPMEDDTHAAVARHAAVEGALWLYWSCPQCSGRWHRWPVGDRLRTRAARFVGEP